MLLRTEEILSAATFCIEDLEKKLKRKLDIKDKNRRIEYFIYGADWADESVLRSMRQYVEWAILEMDDKIRESKLAVIRPGQYLSNDYKAGFIEATKIMYVNMQRVLKELER